MSEALIADIFRVAVLLASAATVGLSLTIVVTYAKVYRAHRKSQQESWRGLLPLHVTLIGIAHLMFVMGAVVEISNQVHGDLTWRAPYYLIANVASTAALWIILGKSRYRQHGLTPPA